MHEAPTEAAQYFATYGCGICSESYRPGDPDTYRALIISYVRADAVSTDSRRDPTMIAFGHNVGNEFPLDDPRRTREETLALRERRRAVKIKMSLIWKCRLLCQVTNLHTGRTKGLNLDISSRSPMSSTSRSTKHSSTARSSTSTVRCFKSTFGA